MCIRDRILTGRLFRYNWDSPSEIKPDDLVNFAAYNNLLELPTEPAGQKICDGASYIDNMAPAEQLEEAVLQYFSVDAQQLHQSSFYDAGAECYTLFSGWGGEYGASVTDVSQEGDILTLKIGEGNFDQPQKEPLGELKVRMISEEKWEYLSYRFEKEDVYKRQLVSMKIRQFIPTMRSREFIRRRIVVERL